MDVENGLLGYLFAWDVISSVEKQSIESDHESYNRRQHLLSLVMMKSTKEYKRFIEGLRMYGQQHLASLLIDQSAYCMGSYIANIMGITEPF